MVKWYTADPHFGHENILKFCKRPFKNTDEMDNAIIRNLWSCVQPEDELCKRMLSELIRAVASS